MILKELFSKLHAPVYERRLEVLTGLILPHLHQGDAILDVGCGSGLLGAQIMKEAAQRSIVLSVSGLERFPRGGEPIKVVRYEGGKFPFPDRAFDVVVIADVLHHENEPEELLRECIRVSKRCLIIKDHQLSGPLAHPRVSLIDWAANVAYDVKCLYRYKTPAEWESALRDLRLSPLTVYSSINLYPAGFNFLFGRQLQYMAICRVPGVAGTSPQV